MTITCEHCGGVLDENRIIRIKEREAEVRRATDWLGRIGSPDGGRFRTERAARQFLATLPDAGAYTATNTGDGFLLVPTKGSQP